MTYRAVFGAQDVDIFRTRDRPDEKSQQHMCEVNVISSTSLAANIRSQPPSDPSCAPVFWRQLCQRGKNKYEKCSCVSKASLEKSCFLADDYI